MNHSLEPEIPAAPVLRAAVSDQVFEALREAILSLGLPEGTRLTEARIAQRFQVSTTPVREALQRLHQVGLVDREPPRGLCVHRLLPQEIRDVYQLRLALEPMALVQSAPHMTAADQDEISDILDQARTAIDGGDLLTLSRLNSEFHFSLIRNADNAILLGWLGSLRDRQRLISAKGWALENKSRLEWEEHRAIARAVRDGEIERAGDLLARHIRRFARRMLNHVDPRLARRLEHDLGPIEAGAPRCAVLDGDGLVDGEGA
jgi:DNA-binding GntR family transcriptional regulator